MDDCNSGIVGESLFLKSMKEPDLTGASLDGSCICLRLDCMARQAAALVTGNLEILLKARQHRLPNS
ncbi:uncharacterized protein N7482_002397 [Penicillium canariense]|uniref:Uncharacterized protein n=1 Tax=Penicillium canariense TaxID=189055 RepID=A0A9W9IFY6_9EURO|nr:uncharacterized protein N7482_002397 [Penicillium canariense]KAJ5176520.1 hypothetical protein N7482_002397 [Penicillium canariense]